MLKKEGKRKTLSIIVPVYNEEKTVEQIIKKLISLRLLNWEKEIIIVDDASSDDTNKILASMAEKDQFEVMQHKINKGKGTAILTGIQKSKGDYIVIQDADLEYDPQDILELLQVVDETGAKAVYGTRFTEKAKDMVPFHREANLFLTFLTNILYGSEITDMETCYKLLQRDLLLSLNLKAKKFDFEPEVTAKILKKGITIKEVPISFVKRGFSEGKKISLKDGLQAIWVLLKYRFVD
jgi:glycosyltransferase involved in cell wall biosynthesis